jgi:hypothetical protein
MTATRRAGGLDFRPAAEKTKARQCWQRYVCESKQSRGARRSYSTPQRRRDEAQRRDWPFYEAITLDFGPWEQIFCGEFDNRRRKRALVKIIGD